MRQLLRTRHGQLCVAWGAGRLPLLSCPADPLVRPPAERPAIQDFFCTASGFGTIVLDARNIRIRMLEGELLLEKLVLADAAQSKTLEWKSTVRPDTPAIKPV